LLPTLVNNLGFGFAASGYSKDGLAILQGIQDTKTLMNLFSPATGYPVNRFFITGASEGGLVATKSVESFPDVYSGGLAVSGPIGNFRKQINYFGDVRVLFDYFFPGILVTGTPGESAISIPPALMLNWSSVYEPKVRNAIRANFWTTFQLINTAKIPIGLNFKNAEEAIVDALWYNIFATDDAKATLAGNPYDNIGKVYNGSFNDAKLNVSVARFPADPSALANLASYETTGLLGIPLVTLHNTADPVIPFWHETLYAAKARATGSSSELTEIPVFRFGHTQVDAKEVTSAFLLMLLKAGL
jgi:pimeloyl-ACP methyl ester carboxylesterase